MKIVHVCPFVGEQLGGSERFVSTLIGAQRTKHDIHLITTTRYPSRAGVQQYKGIVIHRFYSPIVFWNINPLGIILHRLNTFSDRIFHIHSHLYFLSNQVAFMNTIRNMKTLLHLHGGIGPPPFRTSMMKTLSKRVYDNSLGQFTLKHSDIIASVSMKDLDFLKDYTECKSEKLRYIPNYVDTRKFYPKEPTEENQGKVLLYVGDFEPWKGIDVIIDWARRTNHSFEEDLTLRFIGQGSRTPQLMSLQHFCHEVKNKIHVEILGQKSHNEIPEYMRNADALLFTSYWEGLPTVILEAMASGLPVISTPVGDIPRIIENMKNGILVEHNPYSLESAVNMLFEEPTKTSQIALNAMDVVKEMYNLKRVMNDVDDAYEALAKI